MSRNKKKTSFIFNKKELVSDSGMQTAIWGPPLWHFLHTISFNYPVSPTPQDKIHYRMFIEQLQYVLPCLYCRENFTKNLKNSGYHENVFTNRSTFSRWMYRMHNEVNRCLGKSHQDLSYHTVRQRYEQYRSRCSSSSRASSIRNNKKVVEQGCVAPKYIGSKGKCILQIVPRNSRRQCVFRPLINQRC